MKASKFEKAALSYFDKGVPAGMTQRIDAIAVFSDLPRFRFWKVRLKILALRGVIEHRAHRSVWASCNRMPMYGPKARAHGITIESDSDD